jgi:hypothetical protein
LARLYLLAAACWKHYFRRGGAQSLLLGQPGLYFPNSVIFFFISFLGYPNWPHMPSGESLPENLFSKALAPQCNLFLAMISQYRQKMLTKRQFS